MNPTDWYRRTTWSQKDEDDFYQHLKRLSTSGDRARCLRIQAQALASSGESRGFELALRLIAYLIKHEVESEETTKARLLEAICLDELDQEPRAIEAFQHCFAAQRRQLSKVKFGHVDFGLFCVRRRLSHYFRAVLGVFDEVSMTSMVPQDLYLEHLVLALIADDQGRNKDARSHAERALAVIDPKLKDLQFHSAEDKGPAGLHEVLKRLCLDIP